MFNAEGRPRWYALRTRSRHEKQVREWLTKQSIEPLLPTLVRISQWKDRKKTIEVPLFPGYCFAQFQWQDRLSVLKIPGVVQIIGSGNSPEPVPDEEIDALKKLMVSTLSYDAHPYLHEGMAVEVVRGPLEGIRGVLLRKEKRYRLVIAVHLIKQAAVVEIDAADVVPIKIIRRSDPAREFV